MSKFPIVARMAKGLPLSTMPWRAFTARTAGELSASAASKLRLGMAFRWLQIQDPGEAAAQPMASPDGSVWLMFNGEVYNFQEIGRELAQLGHRFASASDTEVILAAYMQWGTGCFRRLNGMWAMILLDLRDRKLIVCRDRFGIKPLFYYRGPRAADLRLGGQASARSRCAGSRESSRGGSLHRQPSSRDARGDVLQGYFRSAGGDFCGDQPASSGRHHFSTLLEA